MAWHIRPTPWHHDGADKLKGGMATELFNSGEHVCLMFSDLADEGHEQPVQSNQFLMVCEGNSILLDPGGTLLTYNELYMAMARFFPPSSSGMCPPLMPIRTSLHRVPSA